MRRSIQMDLMLAAALWVVPLLFFWQVTLGDRTLLPADNLYQFQPFASYRAQLGVPDVPHNMLLSDLVLENLEWKTFLRQSFGAGEIPLWNPYLFGGAPFLAAGQHSGLYPFSVIYYVLPLEKAYGWFTVSQLWLAGLFMYLLMRGLGIGRFGALFSAFAYQFSSFFIASVVFQMVIAAAAWLPFLLLMVEFTLRRRPLRKHGAPTMTPWVILGALGLGMTILAGHVEFVYYALLVMGFWAACRLAGMLLRREAKLRALFRPASALLAMVILGVGVGAVQFVPLFELANASFREGSASFSEVRSYAFPPRQALAFALPNIFGSPAQHAYFDVFTGQTTTLDWVRPDGVRVTDSMMPGGKNYVEGACYVGILTLVFAGLGLWGRRTTPTHGPYRMLFAALAALSLTFVFGTVTYALLYYGLPGINQLHSPFRWVFPLTVCLAALAGFGADALAKGEKPRMAVRLGWLLTGTGIIVLISLFLSRIAFNSLRGPIASLYNGLAGANLAFPTVEAFYSHVFRQVLIFGGFLTASGVVLILSRRAMRLRSIPLFMPVAIGVLLADLTLASAGFNPAADPKWLTFVPPVISWLQKQNPQQWRLTAVEGTSATLNANIPWLFGLQDIRGYDSIILKQYVEYMRQIQPQTQLLFNRVAPLYPDRLDALNDAVKAELLNRLAVRYIVSEVPITSDKMTYQPVYRDGPLTIYENVQAYPRAYVATGNTFTLATNATAQIIEAKGSQVSVDIEFNAKDSTLVLADTYAPGWRAYLRPRGGSEEQETERPILNILGNFRGVSLSDVAPGAYTVRFRYSPPSFQVGIFATFLSLAILLFAAMLWLWQRFYTEAETDGTDGSSGVRRFAKNSLAPIALNLFNRGIDLAFALVMLRLLGPANAGTYYYAVVIFGWFDILTNFGLNTLLTREVARDRASAGRYLLNSSVLRLGLAGLGVPCLILFLVIRSSLGAPLEPLSSTAVMAIVLLYVGLIPGSISTGLSALFYAFEKAEIPAAISTVTAILKATCGLMVLIAGWGVIGLAGVSILLNGITLGILVISARGMIRRSAPSTYSGIDRALIRGMVKAGWPLMLNHLLATLFFKIDVIILEPLKGSSVVGQYSTAYKWVDAIGVIPSLFTMALLPIMSRQAHEDRATMQRNYHFAVKLLVGIAVPIAVMTTFLANALIYLLGGARFLPDGGIALQLMIWFIPIGWINSLTNYVLIALDQQKAMRWAFSAGVIFNIVANLIFVPLYSYQASAIITILSEGVLLVGFYLLLRRVLAPVPWVAMLWKIAAAGAVMAVALALLWPVAPILALIVGTLAYPLTLFWLRPLSAYEQERLLTLVPRRVQKIMGLGRG